MKSLKTTHKIFLWFWCRFWASVTDTFPNLASRVHVWCVTGTEMVFQWLSPFQTDELVQCFQPEEQCSEVKCGCWVTKPSLHLHLMHLSLKRVQVRGLYGGTNSNWQWGETAHKHVEVKSIKAKWSNPDGEVRTKQGFGSFIDLWDVSTAWLKSTCG